MSTNFKTNSMKTFVSFCFLFSIYLTNAQKTIDKESFKKCRKEFSKKDCLSDEDKDGVLFYLDQCPKDAGPVENNGCPWPDTDGDGIIDKDDSCPEIAGFPDNNGCPKADTDGDGICDVEDACPTVSGLVENHGCPIQKLDCTQFYEEEKLKFEKFKIDNKNIESIYSSLSINILNYLKKENNNIRIKEVYVDFLDYGPQCKYYPKGYVPQCNSSRNRDEYNFLITRFWNKNALESLSKKKNVLIQMKYFYTNYEKEFNDIISEELHNFLVKHKVSDRNVVISQKSLRNTNKEISIKIEVKFINPYEIMINYTPLVGRVYEVSKKLVYKDGKWIE